MAPTPSSFCAVAASAKDSKTTGLIARLRHDRPHFCRAPPVTDRRPKRRRRRSRPARAATRHAKQELAEQSQLSSLLFIVGGLSWLSSDLNSPYLSVFKELRRKRPGGGRPSGIHIPRPDCRPRCQAKRGPFRLKRRDWGGRRRDLDGPALAEAAQGRSGVACAVPGFNIGQAGSGAPKDVERLKTEPGSASP